MSSKKIIVFGLVLLLIGFTSGMIYAKNIYQANKNNLNQVSDSGESNPFLKSIIIKMGKAALNSPETRQALIELLKNPKHKAKIIDMMFIPEIQKSMIEVLRDPKTRPAFKKILLDKDMEEALKEVLKDVKVGPAP